MFMLVINRIHDDFMLTHQNNQTFAYSSIINLFSNLFVSIKHNNINKKTNYPNAASKGQCIFTEYK